jgi:cytochrome c553
MKKPLLLGTSFLLVLAVLLFGPEALDLYRLDRFIETSAKAHEANGGPWPQLSDACVGCHGVDGNSRHPGYPSLAGQPAAYVAAQLRTFASGRRTNATMGPLAMTMSEQEIDRLADHFARQVVDENRLFAPDPGERENGARLVSARGCAACHGDLMMGRDTVPRLAGQGSDYLIAQLNAFAEGARSEPTGAMKGIAAAVSPDERKAIAIYLASLSPQKQ